MSKIIPFQNKLRQELPVVIGNTDYSNFKNIMLRINEIIELSQIEHKAIEYTVSIAEQELKPV